MPSLRLQLTTYFLPTVLNNAGVTNAHTQLLYNFANNLLSCGAAFFGAALTDLMPRRPRLYIGSLTLSALLATIAALNFFSSTVFSINTSVACANMIPTKNLTTSLLKSVEGACKKLSLIYVNIPAAVLK